MDTLPEIRFEDDDLLIVSKPRDWLTESGGEGDSLESWLSDSRGSQVWACHRLDKATTGLVILRKNRRWLAELSQMFESKRVRKEYWAVVEGSWPLQLNRVQTKISKDKEGRWTNSEEEGKDSTTTFRILGQSLSKTWLQALPKTGRTHQIRLHCLHAGFPIVGDSLYGRDADPSWLALHARRLDFNHPGSGKAISVVAEPPPDWETLLAPFQST